MEFAYKKSLGQNFIYDTNYLRALVTKLNIQANDIIVEIGAGAGTLTSVLAESGCQIYSVEIDRRLEPILTDRLQNYQNVKLIWSDALQHDFKSIKSFRVIANVPYYITTPLLIHFLQMENCREINILVAKEVAERIVAPVGTAEYGALSIACQLAAKCEIIKYVPRTMFTPQPKVDSAFVTIVKTGTHVDENLNHLLKRIFSARRKTISNALAGAIKLDKDTIAELLQKIGIDANLRPEQLAPTDYVKISAIIQKNLV